MPKPTRTAAQLQAMIKERIDQIPELVNDLGGRENTDIDAGGVQWREPVDGAANWTVMVLRNPQGYRTDISRIIRQLQQQFDLED